MSTTEFTRASLIGQNSRIGKVYGATPLGLRISLAYGAVFGERSGVLTKVLERATRERIPAFYPTNGERCSLKVMLRASRRALRERAQEVAGSTYSRGTLTKRQAA